MSAADTPRRGPSRAATAAMTATRATSPQLGMRPRDPGVPHELKLSGDRSREPPAFHVTELLSGVLMDRTDILARFDREMRQDPPAEPGYRVEREGSIVRQVGEHAWICYSHLTEVDAPSVVAAEAARFRRAGRTVEWKLYGHDGPPALPGLLVAHGFVPDVPETLMVLDLEAPVAISRSAFAPGPGWDLEEYLPKLGTRTFAVFLATVEGRPVSAGRLDLPPGRSFASLWGGGTVPEFRGAGVYRALVAARRERARSAGYRFLTVDARETSRPILERVGFRSLDPVVGWVLTPVPRAGGQGPSGDGANGSGAAGGTDSGSTTSPTSTSKPNPTSTWAPNIQ